MRRLWSLTQQRRLWRRVWVALAEAQAELGLFEPELAQDVRAHVDDLDLERAAAWERELRHDLMAELRTFAGQCERGGRILHLGATSADIQDNADALRLRDATRLIQAKLRRLLHLLVEKIESSADVVCMGFTHLQPAEPTTVGYRLAQYAQDLWLDSQELDRVYALIRGKGMRGAVGTSAAYADLLADTNFTPDDLERRVMKALGIDAFPVTTQVSPRKLDWLIVTALAGIAASLHRSMFDLRILQSPLFGEWSEPFGARQVGSSAMPFKRNPITAEKIDSLARWVATLPRVAWDNSALSLLERTLDDSANRRLVLPQAFLAIDELLDATTWLFDGMQIRQAAIEQNLSRYGPFAAVERVLMATVRAGADRQAMHERLRQHSLRAWQRVTAGENNPLYELLRADPEISGYITGARLQILLDASKYVGDAPHRARQLAQFIRVQLSP